jgi:hypothetical protein
MCPTLRIIQSPIQPLLPTQPRLLATRKLFPKFLSNRPDLSPAFARVLQLVLEGREGLSLDGKAVQGALSTRLRFW